MRKLLLAIATLAVGAPAMAADLEVPPLKAPIVAPPPSYLWTGCYLGGQAGFGFGSRDFSDPTGAFLGPPGASVTDNTGGALAGGQIGCDFQFLGRWVVGLEADYAWADLNRNTSIPFFAAANTLFANTDQLVSGTARLGYTWDRLMFYGKAGVAGAHDKLAINLMPFGAANDFTGSNMAVGWTAGLGAEWVFVGNWSARIELNFYDFGGNSTSLSSSAASFPVNVKEQYGAMTFGINYRFGVVNY